MACDLKRAERICKGVEGWPAMDALSTVGYALIHLCHLCGLKKEQMLHSMSREWDIYERSQPDKQTMQ